MSMHEGLRDLTAIDRVIHEPVRLSIVTYLSLVDEADFVFLQRELGLTKGNLSQHMARLEEAGYMEVEKQIVNKKTRTTFRLTEAGRLAFAEYRNSILRFVATAEGDSHGSGGEQATRAVTLKKSAGPSSA